MDEIKNNKVQQPEIIVFKQVSVDIHKAANKYPGPI